MDGVLNRLLARFVPPLDLLLQICSSVLSWKNGKESSGDEPESSSSLNFGEWASKNSADCDVPVPFVFVYEGVSRG